MQGQITVPDDELDTLARKIGWTDLVNGQSNPIPQDQWVVNKAQEYLNNEAIAAAAISAAETARQQAISDKTEIFSKLMATVTTPSQIQPLPPITQSPPSL